MIGRIPHAVLGAVNRLSSHIPRCRMCAYVVAGDVPAAVKTLATRTVSCSYASSWAPALCHTGNLQRAGRTWGCVVVFVAAHYKFLQRSDVGGHGVIIITAWMWLSDSAPVGLYT